MPEMFEALEGRCLLSTTVTTPSFGNVSIAQPVLGSAYDGGTKLHLVGRAAIPGEGVLPARRMNWSITLQSSSGSQRIRLIRGKSIANVVIPPGLTGDPEQKIVVTLAAKPSAGPAQRTQVELSPRVVDWSVMPNFDGLKVKVDGVATTGPIQTVSGLSRIVAAPAVQVVDGTTYVFDRWTDGGARVHRTVVPDGGGTLVAIYRVRSVDTSPPPSNSGSGATGSTTATMASARATRSLFGTRPILG